LSHVDEFPERPITTSATPITRCGSGCSSSSLNVVGESDDESRGCEVVGCDLDDIEADKGVDDLWEEGEGIATRTATLIVEGELELSSVIEIFAEIERELVPLSADDEAGTLELEFKNVLARVNKERVGVVPVEETSAIRRFSSSSLLGAETFMGVGIGMEAGGERLVRLGVEPEQETVSI